jgi:hypothetical protein
VGPPTSDGCRWWLGQINNGGYGQYRFRRHPYSAHRIAFRLSGGVVTDEAPFVCHRCNHPLCCEPSHLYADNHSGNMRYMVEQGRHISQTRPERLARGERHGSHTQPERWKRGDDHWSRTQPERLPRGERNGTHTHPERVARGESQGAAKLTEALVRRIRAAAADGSSFTAIGARLHVHRSTVARVVAGQTWSHVT